MRRRVIGALLLVLFLTGCAGHVHTVGTGPQGHSVVEARQWYVLWGLVPINDVDTNTMAAGAAGYQIETEQSFLDVVINVFTGMITVQSRTVTVTK